jgi:BRCA1-associated protein
VCQLGRLITFCLPLNIIAPFVDKKPPGDGYVHRLIQSKTDGKLVEVPSPAPACGRHPHHHLRRRGSAPCGSGGGAGGGGGGAGGGYGVPPCSSRDGGAAAGDDSDGDDGSGCEVCAHERDVKDAMVASKLDSISFEYNHLLTSQLDSQRQYFEGLLERQRAELEGRAAAAAAAAERAAGEAAAAGGAAKESERRRAALERKLVRGGGRFSACGGMESRHA